MILWFWRKWFDSEKKTASYGFGCVRHVHDKKRHYTHLLIHLTTTPPTMLLPTQISNSSRFDEVFFLLQSWGQSRTKQMGT